MNFQKLLRKLVNYLKEVKVESRRVNWLTKDKTTEYTIIVIVITLVVAAYLGGLDFIFMKILSKLVLPH